MYQQYKKDVAFLLVYVREAHPKDEWRMPAGDETIDSIMQPKAWDERCRVAETCCEKLKLSMPCAVDSMDDAVDNAYAAWPDRMFIVGADGRIAYAGRQGPWGFKPEEVRDWLAKNVKASPSDD